MHFDVFNGDADGICALIQLRRHQPLVATLVTGVKRDIQLLDKIAVNKGDSLTVLDISLEKNRNRVIEFLGQGATIFYVDHHNAGDIPNHVNLTAIIDTDNKVCTSLLVNNYLNGKYPLWAVTAAYGDNLIESADQLASNLSITQSQKSQLAELGTYLNYNGYGSHISDLHFAPDALYQEMAGYDSPLDFISENRIIHQKLAEGYQQDMANAGAIIPEFESDTVAVFLLPDVAWARRVSGVFGNHLANQNPAKAHAVLTLNNKGGYLVSVRAPLLTKVGADEFCLGFETGGGRKSAAGINHLPKDVLSSFIDRFTAFYQN